MKIKNYKCKCGKDDFQTIKNNYHTGLYCTFCGAFLKWASKDEKNLFVMADQKRRCSK